MLTRIRRKIAVLLARLARQQRLVQGGAAVLFLLLTTAIVFPDLIGNQADYSVGQVAPATIKAEKSIVFEDKNKTSVERNLAAEKAGILYTIDPMVISAVQKDITELAENVTLVQLDEELDAEAKTERLRELMPGIKEADLAILALNDQAGNEAVAEEVNSLIRQFMGDENGISQESLAEHKETINTMIVNMRMDSSAEIFAINAVELCVRPNLFINYDLTRQKQEEAMNAVAPVMVTVQEGEKIIGEGEIITEEHLAKLSAQGLTGPVLVPLVGVMLTMILPMIMVLIYLYQNNREIYNRPEQLYLLGIIVVLVLAISKGITAIDVSRWPDFGAQLGYMAPVAMAGMLVAVLLDSRLAVLVVAVLSVLLGIMLDNQLRFTLVGIAGGLAGIYSVSKLSQRSDLAIAGVYVSLANIASILAVGLMVNIPYGVLLTSSVILGATNGVISSILTNGALPILESAFKLSSPVRLLEFSHPNNDLLKRLMTEAPGTYNHSILVGNLAEAAADAVGSDSLLARVGAYYHDIGKIKRPYFFIENQMISDSPHDKIGPSLSTLIITSHVKDGLEMAKQYKLPQRILDIIEQHHGTSLVTYFYHKALENDRLESVTEEEYRYESSKPKTREAAIVMLADSAEAALRSLQSRTPARVEGMVRKLIKDKLNDGQFDECDLTFQDLDTIANAFVRVLTGIYHRRVEYPDLTQELERRKKRVSARMQSANKNHTGA